MSIAYNAGLTNGIYDSEFDPQKKITRQEIAALIANAMPADSISDEEAEHILSRFEDSALLSGSARKGMALTVKAEIVFGNHKKMLEPTGFTTRAEAAAMIYRYFNYFQPQW